MGIECGECERDLRGGHARDCSRWKPCVCPTCLSDLTDGDGELLCPDHGPVEPLKNKRALNAFRQLQSDNSALRADVERLRDALATIQTRAASTRGEQAYRELPRFVINATSKALRETNIARAALGASSPATPRGPIDWRDGPPPDGAKGWWLIIFGTRPLIVTWHETGGWSQGKSSPAVFAASHITRHCPVTP